MIGGDGINDESNKTAPPPLVHPRLAHHGDPRQHLRDLLGREEFATRLARTRGIHRHQVLVGIPEQVNRVIPEIPQREVTNRVQQLHQLRVTLSDRIPELVRVHIDVVEQPLQVVLTVRAVRRCLNIVEDPLQRLIQVRVSRSTLPHIREQFRRENEKPLLRHEIATGLRSIRIRNQHIIEIGVPRLVLTRVHKRRQVLRNEPVKQHPQHIRLEIPAVHATAKIIRNPPDRLMQLSPLRFLRRRRHHDAPFPPSPRISQHSPPHARYY